VRAPADNDEARPAPEERDRQSVSQLVTEGRQRLHDERQQNKNQRPGREAHTPGDGLARSRHNHSDEHSEELRTRNRLT